MRMTAHSDYALRVLIYLGLNRGRLATSEEIAKAFGISKNHLMKVVLGLANGGFIEAIRGRNGGLRLARKPERIGIGAVIRTTEEDFAIVECLGAWNTCIIAAPCRLKRIMSEALAAWLEVLDNYTLADLIERPAPLRRILDLVE